MSYRFGKKSAKQNKLEGPPSPDEAAASAFGRYLRYGRASRFGRHYFGRYPQFGKKVKIPKLQDAGPQYFGKRRRRYLFGETPPVNIPPAIGNLLNDIIKPNPRDQQMKQQQVIQQVRDQQM